MVRDVCCLRLVRGEGLPTVIETRGECKAIGRARVDGSIPSGTRGSGERGRLPVKWLVLLVRSIVGLDGGSSWPLLHRAAAAHAVASCKACALGNVAKKTDGSDVELCSCLSGTIYTFCGREASYGSGC